MALPVQTQGSKASRDQRGLISCTVPWVVASEADVLSVGASSAFGVPETKREWSDHESGKFLVNITYEGTPDEQGREETYEFDSSFGEEPIESHKDIAAIKAFYGGTVGGDGKITFPEKMPSGNQAAASGLGGSSAAKSGKNPLFGMTTYLVTKAVFRRTYLRRTFPASLLNKIGSVTRTLPGGFPTPAGRDWLFMPPKVSKKGNAFEISEEHMLSAPGGWPPQVYSLIQSGDET